MTALGHHHLGTVQRYMHFKDDARAKLAEVAAETALAGMGLSKKQAV
jgi:hypothetical protein